jgi:hypothetical protein
MCFSLSRTGLACVASAALLASSRASAAITASTVVDYQPGSPTTTFNNPSAALGAPVGDTTFGALTPFNPPFKNDQIVIVGAGGHLTLRLSAPVPSGGAGPELGVFVNNGIVDVSEDGSGKAGSPPATFSALPAALVSVSADGQNFVPLGAQPLVLSNPTNFYTDVTIDNYSAPLGTKAADLSKPFTGSLSSFGGLTYPQIVQLLDGSGGGNWVDVTPAGLGSVEYVRFDVPAGGSQRLVLDAVTALPEPGTAALLLPALVLLSRRRRR